MTDPSVPNRLSGTSAPERVCENVSSTVDSSGESHSAHLRPPRDPGRSTPKDFEPELTLDELSRFFSMPIVECSQLTGFSVSKLQKMCRYYGISRWPFRKVSSIQRQITELQEIISACAPNSNSIVQKRTHEQMQGIPPSDGQIQSPSWTFSPKGHILSRKLQKLVDERHSLIPASSDTPTNPENSSQSLENDDDQLIKQRLLHTSTSSGTDKVRLNGLDILSHMALNQDPTDSSDTSGLSNSAISIDLSAQQQQPPSDLVESQTASRNGFLVNSMMSPQPPTPSAKSPTPLPLNVAPIVTGLRRFPVLLSQQAPHPLLLQSSSSFSPQSFQPVAFFSTPTASLSVDTIRPTRPSFTTTPTVTTPRQDDSSST